MAAMVRAAGYLDLERNREQGTASRIRMQMSRDDYVDQMLDEETAAHIMGIDALRELGRSDRDIQETPEEKVYNAESDGDAAFEALREFLRHRTPMFSSRTYSEIYLDSWDEAHGNIPEIDVVLDANTVAARKAAVVEEWQEAERALSRARGELPELSARKSADLALLSVNLEMLRRDPSQADLVRRADAFNHAQAWFNRVCDISAGYQHWEDLHAEHDQARTRLAAFLNEDPDAVTTSSAARLLIKANTELKGTAAGDRMKELCEQFLAFPQQDAAVRRLDARGLAALMETTPTQPVEPDVSAPEPMPATASDATRDFAAQRKAADQARLVEMVDALPGLSVQTRAAIVSLGNKMLASGTLVGRLERSGDTHRFQLRATDGSPWTDIEVVDGVVTVRTHLRADQRRRVLTANELLLDLTSGWSDRKRATDVYTAVTRRTSAMKLAGADGEFTMELSEEGLDVIVATREHGNLAMYFDQPVGLNVTSHPTDQRNVPFSPIAQVPAGATAKPRPLVRLWEQHAQVLAQLGENPLLDPRSSERLLLQQARETAREELLKSGFHPNQVASVVQMQRVVASLRARNGAVAPDLEQPFELMIQLEEIERRQLLVRRLAALEPEFHAVSEQFRQGAAEYEKLSRAHQLLFRVDGLAAQLLDVRDPQPQPNPVRGFTVEETLARHKVAGVEQLADPAVEARLRRELTTAHQATTRLLGVDPMRLSDSYLEAMAASPKLHWTRAAQILATDPEKVGAQDWADAMTSRRRDHRAERVTRFQELRELVAAIDRMHAAEDRVRQLHADLAVALDESPDAEVTVNQCGPDNLRVLRNTTSNPNVRVLSAGLAGVTVGEYADAANEATPQHFPLFQDNPHRIVEQAFRLMLSRMDKADRNGASVHVLYGSQFSDRYGVTVHVGQLVAEYDEHTDKLVIHPSDPTNGTFGQYPVVDADSLSNIWAMAFDRNGNVLTLPGKPPARTHGTCGWARPVRWIRRHSRPGSRGTRS